MAGGTCEACGEHVVAATQFCTSCGAFLGWENSIRPDEATSDNPARVHAPRAERTGPIGRPPDTYVAAAARPADRGLGSTATRTRAPIAASSTVASGARPASVGLAQVCPDCGTENDAAKRFCRKCGFGLKATRSGTSRHESSRVGWWPRLFNWFRTAGRRTSSEQRSLQAYRRSLSLRVRVLRGVGLAVSILLALGLFRFVGHDPLGWARHRINDARGALVPVSRLTATADPSKSASLLSPPGFAVDNQKDTSWQIKWTATSTSDASLTCAAQSADPAIIVTAPHTIALRAISLRAGLTGPGRLLEYRPAVLELRFSGGKCQRVQLADTFNEQIIHIHAMDTNAVRISVVSAYPLNARAQTDQLSITEVHLLVRPQ